MNLKNEYFDKNKIITTFPFPYHSMIVGYGEGTRNNKLAVGRKSRP